MAGIYLRFPGGRIKALTLSYDDGVEDDIRLIDIMKKHGLKGTFNINSGMYPAEDHVWPEGYLYRRMPKNVAIPIYRESGMEVAVHSLTHPVLNDLPISLCTAEILQDRENLERDYGCIVRGMAYPFGTTNDDVVDSCKACGIVYARMTRPTESFNLPTDWLRLQPTCHHNHPRMMELAQTFVESPKRKSPMLFYLWGHSYEFRRDDNWDLIEAFAEYAGGHNDIWYATNIEIYDYISAYNQLIFSIDGKRVFNPTGTELFFQANEKTYAVKPNECLEIQ